MNAEPRNEISVYCGSKSCRKKRIRTFVYEYAKRMHKKEKQLSMKIEKSILAKRANDSRCEDVDLSNYWYFPSNEQMGNICLNMSAQYRLRNYTILCGKFE